MVATIELLEHCSYNNILYVLLHTFLVVGKTEFCDILKPSSWSTNDITSKALAQAIFGSEPHITTIRSFPSW